MNTIEDGSGSGYRAQVNSNNRLAVQSESIVGENIAARRGEAFIAHGECHLSAAASGGLLLLTNNSTSVDLEITRIYIDPHTITTTDLIITQFLNPTTTTGGTDISTTGLIQKNENYFDGLTATLKISDGASDLTYTGGSKYHSFPVSSMTPQQRNMNGTNVIAPNGSILFGFKTVGGGNAVDGQIISFSINFVQVPK
jgi:hypothetical protein